MQPEGMEQHGDRREGGEERERTDMPDAADQRGREKSTDEEPGEIPGHHQPQRAGTEAGLAAAHRQQRAQKPAAGKKQRDAGEQGGQPQHARGLGGKAVNNT
ncbi:hypothetical protein D9M71_824910 [compost metagenome]